MLVGSHKFSRQHLNLCFQIFDLLGFGIIILDWFVFDRASFCSVQEGAVILSEEFIGRMKASNHATKGIATYRLSQQASQFRVSVRNVNTLCFTTTFARSQVIQCGYNLSQSEQRFVNLNWLFLSFPIDLGEFLSLRSCQINQLQLRNNDIVWAFYIDLLNCYTKDGVTSGRGKIHLMRTNNLILQSIMKQSHHFLLSLALKVEQIFDCVNVKWVPFKFQACWIALIRSCWELVIQSSIRCFGPFKHGRI